MTATRPDKVTRVRIDASREDGEEIDGLALEFEAGYITYMTAHAIQSRWGAAMWERLLECATAKPVGEWHEVK